MKRIALIIAIALPLAACSKEQPRKVAIRPVRVALGVNAYADEVVQRRSQAPQDLLSRGVFRDPTIMQGGRQ